MEHGLAGYLRKVWDTSKQFYEGQHGSRPGYSCESPIVTVCQDIADSVDEGARIDVIIIDFSKSLDLVPYDRLFTKIVASGVDTRVVVQVSEFL
jgi:hypothetical protein